MRFLKSRLPAVIILTILLIIMSGALITARLYSQDSGLYWTPSSLISGEYSIDDGPWIETDLYTPIDERFHKIVFRGRLVSNTSIVKELAISVKNVWFTLAYDDGELIFSNMYRIEGSDMWNAKMNEEALEYLPQIMPVAMRMPQTPGYEHFTFLPEVQFPGIYERDVILTVENPYPPYSEFSDRVRFTASNGNGSYIRTFRETLFPSVFFLLTCFFGIFLFPMLSFLFGKINYQYLSFGFLCLFSGICMLTRFQSWILNMFLSDPVLCMTFERLSVHAFFITMILYCRANMKRDISRIISGIAALVYLLAALTALVLQFMNVRDLISSMPVFNVLMGVIVPALLFLLIREARMDRSALRYLLSWIPLLLALLVDTVDQFIPLKGNDFFVYGFMVTLAVQVMQLIFDLQRQNKQALHYQQIQRELSDLRFPIVPKSNALLRVQCFGNFDVFTPDGDHVRFERSKSKEVFAYLVHRHGSSCTTRELFAAIFEDEPYEKKLQNLLQTYIFAMIKSLKAVGAESAVVRSYNALAVNVDVLDCDYYRFQELDAGAVNAYETEYMSQYPWADFLYNGY